MKRVLQMLMLATCMVAFASLANAQATRTWVSGVGDDVNPCSRTAPCKTFAGAISKTLTDGEINCLDPGGFGAVTVTKSITIDCEDTQGAILASGTTGVIVNITGSAAADPLATVRLRGLSINGAGSCAAPCLGTHSGLRGINVSSANTRQVKLYLEEMFIHGFVNEGVLFNSNGGNLAIAKSTIVDNGTAAVRVDSFGANKVFATTSESHFDLNQEGVRIEDNVTASVFHCSAMNNSLNGYVMIPTTTSSDMTIRDSAACNNNQVGVFALGNGGITGTIRLAGSLVSSNTSNGLQINAGGSILSNGKNSVTTPTQAPSGAFNDQ